jgi:LacI family transcriptional regulator
MRQGKGAKVTVYDLAKELGMSAATISRVMNKSVLVSEKTRKRILAAAKRRGYVKRIIRRPRARAIPTIALFLPRAAETWRDLFYDPAALIEAIESAFRPGRVSIVTAVSRQDIVESKKLGGVDGCLFAFMRPNPALHSSLHVRGIPFVLINRAGSDFSFVSCDHDAGMTALLEAMLATGRPVRPFYLGFSPVAEVSRLRLAALGRACRKAEVPFGARDARELESLEELDGVLLRAIVNGGKTALVCFNDIVAIAALNKAREKGLRVPRDLMISGFDNTPVLAIAPMRIDTVDLEVDRLGRCAAEWLRNRILMREGPPLAQLVAGRYLRGETIGKARGGKSDSTR